MSFREEAVLPSKTMSILFRKRKEKPIEIMLKNQIISQGEHSVHGNDLGQSTVLEKHISKIRGEAKSSKYDQSSSRSKVGKTKKSFI